MNIDISNTSCPKNILKTNPFNISRNKSKLSYGIKYSDYLKTLNYYRNKNKFKENEKRIFFTNKEINSYFNNDNIKPDNMFDKKNQILKEKKLSHIKNNTILKYKRFYNSKLKMNVETNINTIKRVNPNLSINKVNFNISKTYKNEDITDKLKSIKNKLKKMRYQSYNEYNIKKRKLKDMKKSYSTEKNIELDFNKYNSIKPNEYFSIFKLNNSNNKNIKYNSVKSQIKINVENNKNIMDRLNGNNIFDNISHKIGKTSNLKIKLYNIMNIMKRTQSKKLDKIITKKN